MSQGRLLTQYVLDFLNPNVDALEDATEASELEALTSRHTRQAQRNASVLNSVADAASSENALTSVVAEHERPIHTGSPADLEEEAAGEGAFNPETGEINWDCPCLGGMAHGPCGLEFREAFSCFVFSTEDPKGMDCIDKFQNMQQCFQKYPEVYKGELEDDEELDAELDAERQELVNEIAERKARQQEAVPQHRLLEEPPPPPTSKRARPAKKSKTNAEEHTALQESQHLEGTKHSQPESKVHIHDETYSPNREIIFEKQTSSPVSEPRVKPVKDTADLESEILPAAAHDARGRAGPTPKETEK